MVTTAKEAEFRIIEDVGLFNTPVSATFHGRDIFAPVAGWLASGGNFEDVGQVADSITLLPEMLFSVEAEFISAEIIHIDHFGNLITSIKKDDFVVRMLMERNFSLFINDYCVKEFYPNYSVAGETPFLLWGSGGHLEISVRNSNAAAYLGVVCGQNLTLKTAN